MTQDELIELAKKYGASIYSNGINGIDGIDGVDFLETKDFLTFCAELEARVRKEEREACATAAESVSPRHTECGNKIAHAIRARSEP